jgi:phospholipid/cholesterol/gamma-HCH transport system substrate-binding protein
MPRDGTLVKVSIFTVAMLLVAAMLVVVFGEFRFASDSGYHATFTDASRLKAGQDVRIAGVPVGSVNKVTLNPDNTVDVAFDINKRYQLYTSTRAVVRYENLVGDRYLEITSGPGELRKLPPGSTIPKQNTQPALDLDALLGGLRPVLKGLDGAKVNEVSNAVLELLQGQGGALSNCCPPPARSPKTLLPETNSSATSSTTSTPCSARSMRRVRSSTPVSTNCRS